MRPRLRDEAGSTLIAAVLIVFAMLAFGLAMLAASDTQSKTSARERTREASFNLAEAALNAQALQLTRSGAWPSTAGTPVVCLPTSNTTSCPQASAIQGGYTGIDYNTTCASAPATPAWATTVYDSQGEQYWTSTLTSRPNWDSNGDGVIWIRSQATSQCHTVAVVSQVSQSTVPISFPSNVVTANWFATSNQGKKVIVDTLGSGGQPAPIVARCAGLTTAQCLNYPAGKGQVQPPAVRADSSASTNTLTASQLAALQAQAQAAGTYYAGCPTTAQLTAPASGAPVYVKTCNISVTGNTQINSSVKPGALIVESGTLTLGGTVNFYGLVYMVNKQASTGSVVNIGGNAQIYGVVSVDGAGGVTAGSSKTNLVNDPRAVGLLKGSTGARINKNTFRTIPNG
jgi:Tfp pilus assembly protein PilX